MTKRVNNVWPRLLFVALSIAIVTVACGRLPTPTPPPSSVPSTVMLSPTPSPLQIDLLDLKGSSRASVDKLLELKPGVSALSDVYALLGKPTRRRDFPTGIAIMYPSSFGKLPHGVLLDGKTGVVLVVSIYNYYDKPFIYIQGLEGLYGQPVIVDSDRSRQHLFFPGKGKAAEINNDERRDIWYLQLLPDTMTLEDYKAHGGYWQETYAFTP